MPVHQRINTLPYLKEERIMKKFVALMLVLAMVLSCSVLAVAEESATSIAV